MATKKQLQSKLRKANKELKKLGYSELPKVSPKDTYRTVQRKLQDVHKKMLGHKYEKRREDLLRQGVPSQNVPHKLPSDLRKYRYKDLQSMVKAMTIEKVMDIKPVTKTQAVSQAILDVTKAELESVRAYSEQEEKRRKDMKVTVHGEKVMADGGQMTRGEMGDLRYMQHAPTGEFNPDRGFADWNKHLQSIERYLGYNDAQQYKENYIKALLHEYGATAYSLIASLEEVDDEQFLDWYYQEEDVDINQFYELQESAEFLGRLTQTFETLNKKVIPTRTEFSDDFVNRQLERVTSMSKE